MIKLTIAAIGACILMTLKIFSLMLIMYCTYKGFMLFGLGNISASILTVATHLTFVRTK